MKYKHLKNNKNIYLFMHLYRIENEGYFWDTGIEYVKFCKYLFVYRYLFPNNFI